MATYIINSVADLENINNDLSGNYVLGTDIDASGFNFVPIGYSSSSTTNSIIQSGYGPLAGVNATPGQFVGTFDGAGHTISNLTINNTGAFNLGLFSWIGAAGTVQNVKLLNGSLTAGSGYQNIGLLAGWNFGTITNASATGIVSAGDSSFHIGGLVGWNWGGTIANSQAAVSVTGGTSSSSIGGLVGAQGYAVSGSTVTDSYATGNVTAGAGASTLGGLVGDNNGGTIQNSYARGNVTGGTGSSGIGGLAGDDNGYWTTSLITTSYATGNVIGASGSTNVSGLVGYHAWSGVLVTSSYWDTQATGQSTSAGGIGETTTQLQAGLPAGFDPTVWGINPAINNGYPYLLLQPPNLPAVISSVAATASTAEVGPGGTVTLTVNFSGAVTVAGGTPTLALNNGGVATYDATATTLLGDPTKLAFTYTVGAFGSGQNTPDLALVGTNAINLNGATIADAFGTAADLSGANGFNPDGILKIDTTNPIVTSVTATTPTGSNDARAGTPVTVTITLNEAVKVKGTPTLNLNDGGTASYKAALSNTAAGTLVFNYTVKAGQDISNLQITGVNTDAVGASIKDAAGHSADFANALVSSTGLQIDTTAPTVSGVSISGADIANGAGDIGVGSTVTLTVNFSEAVVVDTSGGLPTLSLSGGGKANYINGSGSNALIFSYKVAAKENTSDLAVNGLALNGGSIKDGAGNSAILTGAKTNPVGILQIDGNLPIVKEHLTNDTGASRSDLVTSNASLTGSGNPNAVVQFLVDGAAITAAATADASGKWTFTPPGLPDGQHTIVASETDSAGNTGTASLTFTLDTTSPTAFAVSATPTIGTVSTGSTVVITLTMNELVNVGGTPILQLNNGGSATYASGSGTNSLIFNYLVSQLDNSTSDLQVTKIGLPPGASIADIAGNRISTTNLTGVIGADVGLQVGLIINNAIQLTDDSVPVEMIKLALDSYPFGDTGYNLFDPFGTPLATTNPGAISDIQGDNWHLITSNELGIDTVNLHGPGGVKYAYSDGFYQAIKTGDLLSNDPSEADAIIVSGVVNGKRTLAIAFTGTDQKSDWLDYANFADYYAKYTPLISAIKQFIDSGAVDQILVSGHSLGGAMVQDFMEDPKLFGDPHFNALAWTIGSPGSDNISQDTVDPRITNFYHTLDPVFALIPKLSGDLAALRSFFTRAAQQEIEAFLQDPANELGFTAGEAQKVTQGLIANVIPKFHEGTNVELPFGGTVDPSRVSTVDGVTIDFDEHNQTTYLQDVKAYESVMNPSVALLSQYMASSFGGASNGNVLTVVTNPIQDQQFQLSVPHS